MDPIIITPESDWAETSAADAVAIADPAKNPTAQRNATLVLFMHDLLK